MDWIDLAQGAVEEGCCEQGNETSGSIKCWEVPEYVCDRLLLKKGSVP
jgi:hypothetical protein